MNNSLLVSMDQVFIMECNSTVRDVVNTLRKVSSECPSGRDPESEPWEGDQRVNLGKVTRE